MSYSNSLIPRHVFLIEYKFFPKESESKFMLRIGTFGSVSGCADVGEGSFTTKQKSETLKIEVYEANLSLNDDEPRYTQYDCETKVNSRATFDVELDRDELIEKGIKILHIKSKSHGGDYKLHVDVTKEKMEVRGALPGGGETAATFLFFPKNTVILHAPSSKKDNDVREHLTEYGRSLGLVPLDKEKYQDFELQFNLKSAHNAMNYAYFTDPKNVFIGQLTDIDQNTPAGDMEVMRTVHTANGPVDEPHPLSVYAMLPGIR